MPGSRRRWWLAAMGVLVVATVGPGADAQDAADPYAAFGGLNAHARAGGVQVSYDVEGVLPLPPPLLEVTVPTSRATTTSGPTSLAFGSLAYPGDLIGNLPSLAEQSAPGSGALVPPYPLAVLADHPGGAAEGRQDIGAASATVAADESGARADTTMAATDVPGAITIGTVTTSTRTGVEGGRLVARSRVVVSSVSLLFGAVVLEDVVVDVVAATDGTVGTTDGSVVVGAVSLAGTPVRVGPDGLGSADLDEVLAQAGVRVSIGALTETVDGPRARVDATGFLVELELDGREGALAPLLALLPADQLPGQGVPGLPFNTSPQALVNLLKETHIVQVDLAPVTARVDASPGFVPDDGSVPATRQRGATVGSSSAPTLDGGPFSTPLPGPAAPAVPASDAGGPVPGRAVEAVLGVLLLVSLPAWWRGSARLADACLTGPAAGCAPPGGRRREGGS